MLIDAHAHLDDQKLLPHLDKIIERAKQANLKAIISNGVDFESNELVLKFSEKYNIVKPAFGLHPEFIEKNSDEKIKKTLKQIEQSSHKIIAIGEIGLDYYWLKDENQRERQRKLFKDLLALATKLKKPVIIHSRGAEQDTINIIKEFPKLKVHLHCFGGSKKLMQEGIKLGYYFSIPTSITRSQQFQLLSKLLPNNQMLTETDSPYLKHDLKIEYNEPANIIYAIKEIAKIKQISEKEVEELVYENYKRLFEK